MPSLLWGNIIDFNVLIKCACVHIHAYVRAYVLTCMHIYISRHREIIQPLYPAFHIARLHWAHITLRVADQVKRLGRRAGFSLPRKPYVQTYVQTYVCTYVRTFACVTEIRNRVSKIQIENRFEHRHFISPFDSNTVHSQAFHSVSGFSDTCSLRSGSTVPPEQARSA